MLVVAEKLKPPTLEVVAGFTTVSLPFVLKAPVTDSGDCKLDPNGEFVIPEESLASTLLVLAAPNTNPAGATSPAELFTSVLLELDTDVASDLPKTAPAGVGRVSFVVGLVLFEPNLNPSVGTEDFVSVEKVNPPVGLLELFSDSETLVLLPLPKTKPDPLLFEFEDILFPNLNPEEELELDDPASNLKPPVLCRSLLDFDSSLELLFTLKPESGGLLSDLVNENPPVVDTLILPLDVELVETGMLNPLDWDMVYVFTQLGTETEAQITIQ